MTIAHRDSLVICGTQSAAEQARRDYPTLEICTYGIGLRGFESIPDTVALAQRWGRLTKRCPNVTLLEVPPVCNEAVKQLSMATAANLETTVSRGRQWVTHYAENLWRLCWDAPGMAARGCIKGAAAIIVGAGPSLDKNFEDIERFRGKALVIGVNSATRAVECDVHVCIEANDLRRKLSERPAIRAFGLACPPELMEHGGGKLAPVWNGDLSRLVEGMTGMKRLPTSASGTTAAVALALLWGCDPIVLIGQDLAFSGGQVYAERTGYQGAVMLDGGLLRLAWSDAAKELPRTTALPELVHPMDVQAWGGNGTVTSTPGLAVVRHWLADVARQKLATCINATEGGANVPGWADKPLRELELPRRDIPPERFLRGTLGVAAPVLGPKRLRAWRDDQVSGLQAIADLAVRVPNMAGKRHLGAARLLAEGIATVPMVEPWLAEELVPLAMLRQMGRCGTVQQELDTAREDIDAIAANVARGALELAELLRSKKYGDP